MTDPKILERNKRHYEENIREIKIHCPLCDKDIICKFYKQHCQSMKHKFKEFQSKEEN